VHEGDYFVATGAVAIREDGRQFVHEQCGFKVDRLISSSGSSCVVFSL